MSFNKIILNLKKLKKFIKIKHFKLEDRTGKKLVFRQFFDKIRFRECLFFDTGR